MDLTWYGLSCFRIAERNYATVVTDPFQPELGHDLGRLKAKIVTQSHDAAGHNYLEAVQGYSHALTGPGEYEIGNVFITAVASPSADIHDRNVIFLFDYDSITIAHMGDIAKVPSQTQIEALGQVNVLLLPVGGGASLNGVQAAELVSMIEPNLVVPMHYALPGLNVELDSVERFLKEVGVTEWEPQSSLRVSATTLPEETQVVVLEAKV